MPAVLLMFLGIIAQKPVADKAPAPPKVSIVDVTLGKGPAIGNGDFVSVDYTGKLEDGKVFDTSKKPGRTPFTFFVGLGQVIPGWDQGLIGMKEGGVRKLTIPSALAYGPDGQPPVIPPNATLVFTISVNKVVPLDSPEHPVKKLKIDITKQGVGAALTFGDSGSVRVTAKHPDGTVFLSTAKGMPEGVHVQIGALHGPAGFTFGLLGMKVGEQRTVTVPGDLAFGPVGNPDLNVKPNETLTFELELVTRVDGNAPKHNKDPRR